MFGKSFSFYLIMLVFAIVLVGASFFINLDARILAAYFGMCSAIASRLVYKEMLEWVTLILMITISSILVLIIPPDSDVRIFAEFVFWWGVFGIPLRATIRRIDKRNES